MSGEVSMKSGPDEFSREMISEHNKYRELHGSPPLKWSSNAAAKAQEWADHLASKGQLQHGNDEGMGQNLVYYSGYDTFTAEQATKMWYNEIQSYNFNHPGFASTTGHFTQVVWAETNEIGVGRAVKGQSTFVVANYLPPVNILGKYEENVKPPAN